MSSAQTPWTTTTSVVLSPQWIMERTGLKSQVVLAVLTRFLFDRRSALACIVQTAGQGKLDPERHRHLFDDPTALSKRANQDAINKVLQGTYNLVQQVDEGFATRGDQENNADRRSSWSRLRQDGWDIRRVLSLGPSGIVTPEMRDPLSIAISFMLRPSLFRQVCKFTKHCWENAVYLEGTLPCSYAVPTTRPCSPHEKPDSLWGGHQGGGPVAIEANPAPQSDEENADPVPVGRVGELPGTSKLAVTGTRAFSFRCDIHVHLPLAEMLDSPESSRHFYHYPGAVLVPQTMVSVVRGMYFSHLPLLRKIARGVRVNGTALTTVHFINLPALVEIAGQWMQACESLETIVVAHLPKLESIGDRCLDSCKSLSSVTFDDLPALTQVGERWMNECPVLRVVLVQNLPSLESVGNCWLLARWSLTAVTIRNAPKLDTIPHKFFYAPASASSAWTPRSLLTVEGVTVAPAPEFDRAGVDMEKRKRPLGSAH